MSIFDFFKSRRASGGAADDWYETAGEDPDFTPDAPGAESTDAAVGGSGWSHFRGRRAELSGGLDNAKRMRRRKFTFAAAAVAVLAVVFAASALTDKKRSGVVRGESEETTTLDLTFGTDRLQREKWAMSLEGQFTEMMKAVGELTKKVDDNQRRIQLLTAELNRRAAAGTGDADGTGTNGSNGTNAGTSPLLSTQNTPTVNTFGNPDGQVSAVPGAAPVGDAAQGGHVPQLQLFVVSDPKTPPEAGAVPAGSGATNHRMLHETPLAPNRAGGSRAGEYLPASSFVSARLLTGGYVGTGAGAGMTPIPVVMRLEEAVTLPNMNESDLSGCFVSGSATGDLSSERVHIRLDRLSCVAPTGEALDMRVQGWVYDNAGMLGLPGKLITRSGQAIANALSVSILSGIGEAVSLTSQTTSTSTLTGTQTSEIKNAWGAGLGKGISDGFDRIAEYYLDLADRIFPVLEVTPGQRVDVVFAQGALIRTPGTGTGGTLSGAPSASTAASSAGGDANANTLGGTR